MSDWFEDCGWVGVFCVFGAVALSINTAFLVAGAWS